MAHIVITGASSGLGEHLAVELGRRGHALGLVARRADELERVATLVRQAGGRASCACADVTDGPAVKAAIGRLVSEAGPVDILIANAGGGGPTPASKIDAARIAAIMRLNFEGVVYAFEAVLPDMIARKSGQIVAVSSIAAWRGLPPTAAYSASKAAVSSLMEAFSAELRPMGVAVTTVHPGFVRTAMTAKNKFPMPFLMDPEPAARVMADGILARRRRVDFPAGLVALMRFATWLPAPLFEQLIWRFRPKVS